MIKTDPSGVSYGDHLEQIETATGVTPPEAIPPEHPTVAMYLWEWFLDLARGRPVNLGMGAGTLSYDIVKAWLDLRGHIVYDWEIDALLRLDSVWVQVMNGEEKPASG